MKEYYKKDFLEKIVSECYSYAEILRSIGLSDKGSNFKTIKKYCEEYKLDTSHFSGARWNKNKSYTNSVCYRELSEVLQNNIKYSSTTLKHRLICEGIKECKCEKCGYDKWMGKPIPLELHHINGNHYDNRLENLEILCPNCHSQTDTYRRPKKKKNENETIKIFQRKKYECVCLNCGKQFKCDRNRKFCCRECYNNFLYEATFIHNKITKEKLEKYMYESTNFSELAKKLNTSRLTVKKYLKIHNLYDIFENEQISNSFHCKKILQYDLNMNLIKEWNSITEAKLELNLTNISKCLRGVCKTSGGFIWKYKKDID